MEIHKPKPFHNWREFLAEIVVVVSGVLIALTLEQVVENWREYRQHVEARDAMRTELAGNFSMIARRNTLSACAKTRVAQIAALLDKAQQHQAFDPPSWIGYASSARIRFAAEADASRSGLFSPAEQRQFSLVYSFMHSIDAEQDRERQAWARLKSLEGLSFIPPEMIANLREALAQARFEDERIVFLQGFAEGYAKPLALAVAPVDPGIWPDAWPLCLPLDTPQAEGVRRSAYHMDLLIRAEQAQ